MNKAIWISSFMAWASLAFGSAEHLLIPPNLKSSDFALKQQLSQEQIDSDLQILVETLQKGYGGYRQLKDVIDTRIVPKLKSRQLEITDSLSFCRTVGSVLNELPDNHVSVRYFGSDERCGKTPARSPSVGPNVQSDQKLPWGFQEIEISGKLVPVISIVRMEMSSSETWNGFLEKIKEIYQESPALIIDLRGNRGGDDSKAHEMALILSGLEYKNVTLGPAATLVQLQTPESLAIFSNFFMFSILESQFSQKSVDPVYQQYYENYLVKYQQAEAGVLPTESERHRSPSPIDAVRVFKGPIRILMDAACASSCESGISFFEGHPTAKTVGESTGGFVHFGNVGKLWLKNSNVFVHLPIQSWVFDDGRFIEKTGITPAIVVPSQSDALEAAKKDIAELLSH